MKQAHQMTRSAEYFVPSRTLHLGQHARGIICLREALVMMHREDFRNSVTVVDDCCRIFGNTLYDVISSEVVNNDDHGRISNDVGNVDIDDNASRHTQIV